MANVEAMNRRSTDHTTRNWVSSTTILVLSVVSVLGLVLAGSSLLFRFNQTDEFRSEQKSVWFSVICSIEQSVKHDPKFTEPDRQKFFRFYDGLLVKKIHTRPCGFVSTRTERR